MYKENHPIVFYVCLYDRNDWIIFDMHMVKVQFHVASKSWRFTSSPSIFIKMANSANKCSNVSQFHVTFDAKNECRALA